MIWLLVIGVLLLVVAACILGGLLATRHRCDPGHRFPDTPGPYA